MISHAHYQERRQKIFDQMSENSIALLPAALAQYRNADTEYAYRQDSYFYYLTGLDESDVIAALVKKEGACQYILFCQAQDPQQAIWVGPRIGCKEACEIYGADEAYPLTEISKHLLAFFSGIDTVYYLFNSHARFEKKLFSWINANRHKTRTIQPHRLIDLRTIVDELRLIKTPEEIKIMREVCDISAKAHAKAMAQCRVGLSEYSLEAILLYEFGMKGARHVAYPCIVAGGNHACTLHYTANNAVLKENELVLIDAGAEYEYYAADITRTFPINGKFTKEQQAIYELVLAAQMAAIEYVKPNILWEELQQRILNVIVTGLTDLKILQGDPQRLIEEKAYFPFYMHNSGHWLGMDVHDVGAYKIAHQSRPLRPGMVFTIEPGLYFAAQNTKVPEKWRGIGVRIEDDILVTEAGKEVLTEKAPKKVDEIQKMMQAAKGI